MKVNCKALKVSIWISSVSLVLAICFKVIDVKYGNNFTGFMKDIILGIFCSSVVTVFFYSSAYKVERKKLLEQYWNEVRRLLIELRKIEYLNTEYEPNLLIGFINEKSKLWIKEYYKLRGKELPQKEINNTNLIKNEIRKKDPDFFDKISEQAGKDYLDEKVDKIYNKTLKDMNKRVDQYLNYLNCRIDNLNFILGDMEFFTGKNNYIKAYDLFKSIYDLRIKIQEAARHFRYYKDGEGSKAVVLSEIIELQKSIFRAEENKNTKIIYSKFCDMMELKLEEFRANIIYNIEPDKIEIIPLLEIVNKSNENKVKN